MHRQAVCIFFIFALCTATAALAPILNRASLAQVRDTVVVGLFGEPDSLLPGFSSLAVAREVSDTVFVRLTALDADWRPRASVAQEVPTLENGGWRLLPDGGMELTYRLRPGFRWHDGTPVTAGDAVFAWEVLRDPRTGAHQPDPALTAMTAPDPQTLVVRWSARRHGANVDYYPLLPRHLLEATFRSNPAALRTGPFASRPVGNGPYRVVEWVPGRHIRLQAVEEYPEGRPRIPNLVFRFFASTAAAAAEELHVDATGGRSRPGFELLRPPSSVFEHISLNLDHPWLQDRRVRQALLYALDRELIAARVGLGQLAEVARTWVPPAHAGHHAGVRRYTQDADAARRLLAEAGWTPGPDGIVRNSAGERLELVISTTPGNLVREHAQDLLIERWRAVGVAVRKENPPDFFQRVRARRFQLALFAWVLSPQEDGFFLWHSSQVPSQANRFQGGNYPGWRHPDNDRLVEQAAQELAEGRRADLLRRQQDLWAEELPALPLWFRTTAVWVHPDLTGVKPSGLPGGLTWNVHEWAWKP
jgi:peptide/nickel transport system substrate-binding protein